MLNWLVVDLNSYFAAVEQQINPDLRGRPVGVIPMMAETTCCIAASIEAKRYGVKTGTSVRDARLRCPDIVFVEAIHERYVEYHEKIVNAIESCHPINSVMSIDEMACQLRGRDQTTENAIQLAKDIKYKILSVGSQLTSSVGIAPNRFLAKTASDMQKPDGLTVIQKTDLPNILYKLRPKDLCGIGVNMEARLHRSGIYTTEQLCQLSIAEMKKIWGGIGGEYFYLWLHGEDFLTSSQVNQSVGHSHVLPPEYRTQAKAYSVAQRLLHKAAVRLRRLRSWTRRMGLSIRYVNQQRWGQEVKMIECQDDITLREVLKTLWQQQICMPPPIKISITLWDLVHEQERSFCFFEDPKRNQLSKALDEINTRYGRNTVYFGGIHEAKMAAPTRIAFTSIPDFSS